MSKITNDQVYHQQLSIDLRIIISIIFRQLFYNHFKQLCYCSSDDKSNTRVSISWQFANLLVRTIGYKQSVIEHYVTKETEVYLSISIRSSQIRKTIQDNFLED